MTQVTKEEFDAFIQKHSLTPDGFKINGGLVQTKFYNGDRSQMARHSEDGFGVIYEIQCQDHKAESPHSTS